MTNEIGIKCPFCEKRFRIRLSAKEFNCGECGTQAIKNPSRKERLKWGLGSKKIYFQALVFGKEKTRSMSVFWKKGELAEADSKK